MTNEAGKLTRSASCLYRQWCMKPVVHVYNENFVGERGVYARVRLWSVCVNLCVVSIKVVWRQLHLKNNRKRHT